MYKSTANGSKQTKVFTLKDIGNVELVSDPYIYYQKSGKSPDWITTFYRYDMRTKKSTKLSESTYRKLIAW